MKLIKTGQDAREALRRGIDKVADCVKVTLGPSGKNAILGRQGITPRITNDGVSIAREIELEDEFEELGAMIVKEASSLADIKGGDGTTTTTVLLQAIVNSVFNSFNDSGSLVKKNFNSIAIKKEITEACRLVVEKLKEKAKPITKKQIYDVALVSAEFDWLAKIITSVFEKIGVDGYVKVEEGVTTSFEVFNGLELPTGFHSDYYINNGNNECVLNKPYILVTNNRLENATCFGKVVAQMLEEKASELIVIAPDFSKELLNSFVKTKIDSQFTIVALKLPTFDKDELLVDVSLLTGAKFLDKNTYTAYEEFEADFDIKNLGTVTKAVLTNAKTLLIGGSGKTEGRIKELKKQIAESDSVFDKDKLEKRIANLDGGFATIKIGSYSDSEKTYFLLKAEDAVNAVQKALKSGVVKGGGLALLEVSEKLKHNILSEALKAPYKQIQDNAGGKLDIPDNVVDPVDITISSLESACSLASNLITTEVAVAYKNEPKNNNED